MLAIELLVEEILRLQNLTMFLQAQLQEARQMQETSFEEWWDYVNEPYPMNAQELIGRMCASPLVIQYDERDEIIHTDDNPECEDPNCPCHWALRTEVGVV